MESLYSTIVGSYFIKNYDSDLNLLIDELKSKYI